MWMHRIRQAGMVGAHVDSEWARSVEDAQRVVETLHKLLWWLTATYDTVPAAERPSITWSALDTPQETAASESLRESSPASAAAHVNDDDVRQWVADVRRSAPDTPTAQRAALHLLQHIHAANTALLTPFSADA
jgi:hypothetical protein